MLESGADAPSQRGDPRPCRGEDVAAPPIAQRCRARLAAIKVPRYVTFVDSLPLTATQRVQKFPLRQDASPRARAIDLGG